MAPKSPEDNLAFVLTAVRLCLDGGAKVKCTCCLPHCFALPIRGALTVPCLHKMYILITLELQVDYQSLAAAHGMTANSAYFRLWSLKKKAVLSNGSDAPGPGDGETGKPVAKSSKKRGRPSLGTMKGRKSKKQKLEEEAEGGSEDDGAADEEDTDAAGKVKVKEDHEE